MGSVLLCALRQLPMPTNSQRAGLLQLLSELTTLFSLVASIAAMIVAIADGSLWQTDIVLALEIFR